MLSHLKLSDHGHTGRLRPHEHTSYLPLAFIVFIVGLTLVRFTVLAYADHPPPQAGSIGLTGAVPAAPPNVAATINTPRDGQHFTTTPITVSGTCPKDTLVEVYKNNIFAGSTPCDNGKYSVDIDLLFGQNNITVLVYDALNQAGPISKSVTVFFDYSLSQAAPSAFFDLSGSQLLLNTDAAYRGSFPNQQLNVPITVIGGTAPYAINVQWGDVNNQVISRSNNSTFNASHAYKKPGTYKITLQGSDSNQLVAFLSVAAIVNGKPELQAASGITAASANKLLMLWPVYTIVVTTLISFWIGERREKKILGADAKNKTPPFGNAAPPSPPATK